MSGIKWHDRSSAASCSCRRWSYPAEDRDDARRRARGHRQNAAAAMLAAILTPEPGTEAGAG